ESHEGFRTHEFVTDQQILFKRGKVQNYRFYLIRGGFSCGEVGNGRFSREMVMEDGTTMLVPLFETYLLHWQMCEYVFAKSDRDMLKYCNLTVDLKKGGAVS
ncbi:hypothetical protein KC19_5G076900, partial [Ceratodon purpureus]